MKKKIAVVLYTEPEWGGGHQYAVTIMECLCKERDGNICIVAICAGRFWKKWCKERGIRILSTSWFSFNEEEQVFHVKFPLLSRIYCTYMTELGRKIQEEKVDAVLCTTQGVFIPNLNTKVIAPVHDLMHRYESRFPEVKSEYKERELIFISKAKYTWSILVDSKVGKKQFIESYLIHMKNKHPRIVSLPFIVPKHIFECKEKAIEVPKKYVFYPAQFWKHKNHLNLIKAVQILLKDVSDIHLVLVGSEKNNMKNIKRYISENRLDNYITIKGFVSNENITYLYKHAVGLVMPSYFGPTNIPPLEAMALGCPVAVSNKYAMREQVGDAGLFFNPDSPFEIAECIKKMWCDNELRKQMVRNGYKRINEWTEKEFSDRLWKIIDHI